MAKGIFKKALNEIAGSMPKQYTIVGEDENCFFLEGEDGQGYTTWKGTAIKGVDAGRVTVDDNDVITVEKEHHSFVDRDGYLGWAHDDNARRTAAQRRADAGL